MAIGVGNIFSSIILIDVKHKMMNLILDENSHGVIISGHIQSGIYTAKSTHANDWFTSLLIIVHLLRDCSKETQIWSLINMDSSVDFFIVN